VPDQKDGMMGLIIVAAVCLAILLVGFGAYYWRSQRVVDVSVIELSRGVMVTTSHHGIRLSGGSYVLIGKKNLMSWLEAELNQTVSVMSIPDGIVVRLHKEDILDSIRSAKGKYIAVAEMSQPVAGGSANLMQIIRVDESAQDGPITLVKLPTGVMQKIIDEKQRIEELRKTQSRFRLPLLK